MSQDTLLLPDQRELYEAITREVQRLVDDASYPQACERVNMFLAKVPDVADNRMLRSALLAQRAEVELEAEDYEEAVEDAQAALEGGWETAKVYAVLAWSHYHSDRPERARESFDQALAVEEYDPSLLMGRALVLMELDELELARADLTNAIHSGDPGSELFAMRGEVYGRLGNLEQAERDIRRARETDPEDPDYALSQARLFFVTERHDQALVAADDAVAAEEPALDALLLRSYLHLVQGRLKEARDDAMRASNGYPDEAFAFIQLAYVQLASGNTALALKASERAVRLDPTLSDAYQARGAARQMKGEAGAREDYKKASQADTELPVFLFGPFHGSLQRTALGASARQVLERFVDFSEAPPQAAGPDPQASGAPGGFPDLAGSFPFPGLDPMKMLGQVFDDEGNVRGPFKPILQMAMRNAPQMLKHVPPGMLKNMGGLQPEDLEGLDMSQVDPDQLEAQLREFYKLMKSGQSPQDILEGARGPQNKKDED